MIRVLQIMPQAKRFPLTKQIIHNLPVCQEILNRNQQPLYTCNLLSMTWATTQSYGHDMGINLINWQSIVDDIDPKTAEDCKNVVLTARAAPSIFESRREFIKQISEQKGVGPKKLALVQDLLKVHVPIIRSGGNTDEYMFYDKTRNMGFVRWSVM